MAKPINTTDLTIFIAQPMTGLSEDDILRTRKKYADLLAKKFPNAAFVSAYESGKDLAQSGASGLKVLANAIEMIADADFVVFLPGHGKSSGCRVEQHAADEFGVTILKPQQWLDPDDLRTYYNEDGSLNNEVPTTIYRHRYDRWQED